MIRRPPISTRTATLFPYTTLFRSVTAGIARSFVKATPEYLADFERRHARATEAYRRQQAAEAADSGFDFGQVLALGLGAAVISSADLPGVDKMQLGQAFVSDVLEIGRAHV